MDIALIHVTCVHAIAKNCVPIPAGIIGARVSFEFADPLWDGLGKMAVFRNGDITKDVILEGDSCEVPAEVVAEPDTFLDIGVYGSDPEGGIAIPTLWAAVGTVYEATDPSGDASTDPTLPVWAQVLRMDYNNLRNIPCGSVRSNTVTLDDASMEVTEGQEKWAKVSDCVPPLEALSSGVSMVITRYISGGTESAEKTVTSDDFSYFVYDHTDTGGYYGIQYNDVFVRIYPEDTGAFTAGTYLANNPDHFVVVHICHSLTISGYEFVKVKKLDQIYLPDLTLTAPDGSKFKLTVDAAGNLGTAAVNS